MLLHFRPAAKAWATLLAFCTSCLALVAWIEISGRNGKLYCIAEPGTVWNGLATLPADWTPACPVSRSYRQEIRQGSSRVEQYRLGGWQPLAARELLGQAGYTLVEDELRMPTHYSAFLGRVTPAELHLTAVQDGSDTLVTISGAQ